MTCSDESESVIVAIFHKISGNNESIPPLVKLLKQEFVSKFAEIHLSLRKEIDSIVAEKEPALVSIIFYFILFYYFLI